MSCLDNIVTTGWCGETATSGLTLKDAPEISSINLAEFVNEDTINGKALASQKLALAINLLKNDLQGMMAANNVLPNLDNKEYTTGVFNMNVTVEQSAIEKGVALVTNPRTRGKLRKTIIHTVQCYPVTTQTGVTMRIYDDYAGGIVSTYSINLVGGETNSIDVEYTIKGSYARVIFIAADLELQETTLTTCVSCGGDMPNDCAYAKSSYNGKEINGKKGWGVLLVYSCDCDYDELMCAMQKQFIAQLIWYKARILLMEELIMSNRLNNWTVFNAEAMGQYLAGVKTEYQNTWNTFTKSLPQTLKQYQDSCLNCRGVQWVTNI